MHVTAIAAAAALLLAAPSSAHAAVAGTGLRGTVVRSPTAPVCRVGQPCSAPAADTVLVFRQAARTRRTRTDAAGRYSVLLPAGVWSVSLTRTGIGTAIAPARVRVVAGRMLVVRFSIDTGIR